MSFVEFLVPVAFAATVVPFAYVNVFTLRRLGHINRSKLILNFASLFAAAVLALLTLTVAPNRACGIFFVAMQLAGLTLFVSSIRAHRCAPAHAFINERPAAFTRKGPYRVIRHPVYAAYMLFWLSGAFLHLAFLSCSVILFVGYWLAAAREERAFLSDLQYAGMYAAYRQMTGAFVPRWWIGTAARRDAIASMRSHTSGPHVQRLPKSRV